MAEENKILVIGGTGYIGKYIVEASAKAGHPTFVLIRESATNSSPAKSRIIDTFNQLGVTILHGDIYDPKSLVEAIKQVDVVISAVGSGVLADQVNIISAIKEAGNIKRFLPSEFGDDVDCIEAVDPIKTTYETKAKIRRAVEAEGIPYTYVCAAYFAGYGLSTLFQPEVATPPRDKIVILGDGNPKAIFVMETDVATYTIRCVDDPATLNKIVHIRPPNNVYSFNDLVSLWEQKIGHTIEKEYVPEEQVLKNIEEADFPLNLMISVDHSVFVRGNLTNFEIDPASGLEASELYPDVQYTTVDEYLDQFV